MDSSALEQILSRLLEPDNDVIQKATLELKEAFKDPSTLQNLCHILGSSSQPQIRQYAAVLVRRKIHKTKQWASLDNTIKESIRGNILQLLIQEQNNSARSAIAQICGVVARHDTPTNQWPQLFEFLVTFVKDEDPAKRELGMVVLSTVTSIAAEQMKPHMVSLLGLLTLALNDGSNSEVAYLSIKCMTDLVFYIGDDEMTQLQTIVPRVLQVVQDLAAVDEEKACTALELFDELLESEVAIIVPHLKTLVMYCLQIASSDGLSDTLRVKAMSFVSSLVRLKKKMVLKQQLVDPILQCLFPIICSDEEDDEDDDCSASSPPQYAVQVIDTMALHLPAEKFIKKVSPMVEQCLAAPEPSKRRAAFLVLAVIVEGAGEYIMTRLLPTMLQTVYKGLHDEAAVVRNAALFAVGQFSEHLQPNISNYAQELLPLLFEYLNKSMADIEKNPKGVIKSHYALEMFCENLGDEILPFLDSLMQYLLRVLRESPQAKPKELSISAIGAAANAAGKAMQPYFPKIIELFKGYLETSSEEEDMKKLQCAAMDTLSVLARTVGEEVIRPMATQCVTLGLEVLGHTTDPDLRRCVYGLFAAISINMKGEMAEYLERIVGFMINSIKSTEGVKAHFKNDQDAVTVFDEDDFNDDENLDADDEDNDYKLEGISIENAYLDEKEDAAQALGEVALNVGAAFIPYMDVAYREALELLDYPAPGIKKGCFEALSQFCLCVHQAGGQEDALKQMIVGVVPKYLECIKTEMDRTVVMQAVDALQEMLDKIGAPVLEPEGASDAILTAMKHIFTHKIACQDQGEDDDDEANEAEHDGMLIESAGDVLPVMARLLGAGFLPFFTSFVDDLTKRMKETSSVAEKSFAVGTLAEVIEASGPTVGSKFIDTLFPLFSQLTGDEDEEVRSNSVFATGVLAINGGEAMLTHYEAILKTLFAQMSQEDNARVLDNICAAVCRMVWHAPTHVPVPQVLPIVMNLLPLKEDMDEYVTVFTCLLKLYQDHMHHENHPEIIPFVPKILSVAAMVVEGEKFKPELKVSIVAWVKDVYQKFPTEFNQVKAALDPEQAASLDKCLTS